MSEQNPPSGQPAPPPGEPEEPTQSFEGAGPTTHEEAAPPAPADTTADAATPPPPVPPASTTEGADYPAPPPPAKNSKAPWIIGVAVVLVLALVGGAVALIVSATSGPDTHTITLSKSAGGMKRDTAKETELKAQLDATAKQFQTQFKGSSIKSALYSQDDTDRGPKGELLVLGFTFKTATEKNQTSFIDQLNKVADANKLEVTKISTGDAGGKAVCVGTAADAPQKNSTCLWVTRDTAGAVLPSVGGYSSDQLSKIMTAVREDVEKTD